MTPTVAWTVISILSIIIFTQLYFLIRFVRYIFDMEDSAQNSIDSLEAIRQPTGEECSSRYFKCFKCG